MAEREASDTVQLKVRLKEPDRAALEKSAQVRGVSLNTEIVDRLRRSFVDDRSTEEVFGSKRTYDLMKLIAAVAANVTNLREPDADWLSDPYLFDQVATAILAVIETVRPVNDVPSLEEQTGLGGRKQGKAEAHLHLQREIESGSSLAELIREEKLPGRLIAKISDELLPFVEQAKSEKRSVLEVYKEAQAKKGQRL